MNILDYLTIKNLKLNKKRAIGTIIGIILSVALICAVSGMVTSFHETLVQNSINEYGYYHIELAGLNNSNLEKIRLNNDIKDINIMYDLGYSYFDHEGDKDSPYIRVFSINKEHFDNLSYTLLDGRFPNNENEIIVSKKTLADLNYKIGDTIKLNIGERKTGDGFELDDDNPYLEENDEYLVNTKYKEYKIVGTVYKERQNHMYYAMTTNDKSDNIKAYLSLKNPRDYKQSFIELLGANNYKDVEHQKINDLSYDYIINNELLRWEVFAFSDSTVSVLITLAGIVIFIIILTSVFCIRNSFAISTTEKMRMYGMLSSVGATKKQIKKSVITEGIILGLIGIPLGIISGIFAVFVLIKVVNMLLGDFMFNNIDGIIFKISILPIIISIILGFITIYLSSISSARRAGRVSPIDNLRNSQDIKISSKKLKTPKIISKLFKTGGVLAYKNLKRSKKKYRTTIISLTVSIFVFISMFAFITEGFNQTKNYYTDYDYNIVLSGSIAGYDENKLNKLKSLDDINNTYITYKDINSFKIFDTSKVNMFFDDNAELFKECDEYKCEEYISINLIALDDETFRQYAKKIGLKYNEIKDKGILIDEYRYYSKKQNKEVVNRRYNYKVGDTIIGKYGDNDISIKISSIPSIRPYGLEHAYYGDGYLVVNKNYYSDFSFKPYELMIQTDNPDKVVKEISSMDADLNIFNIDEQAKAEKAMLIVISIFLYGFIIVITLIGVTNIFNTITSNMELRSKEFATLKSIGMTKKEFNRMINLETLFYSTKSLIYGTILGIIGAFAIHKALDQKTITTFVLPYKAIIICIVFVFVIVYVIMKYSINKINKQNTIETIRNENI